MILIYALCFFIGWESRRKRTEGHDICIFKLGCRGRIVGFDVDTSFFNGNQPHSVKIEGVDLTEVPADHEAEVKLLCSIPDSKWTEILPTTDVGPTCHNYKEVAEGAMRQKSFTHLRYHMFPDGGTARLRVYGEVNVNWAAKTSAGAGLVDLAAFENGGNGVACSDEHFGRMKNLCMPGRGINMGDGWETRRRRGPGFDWVIVRLGAPGNIKKIVVDTAWFKGNFPHAFSLEGLYIPEAEVNPVIALGWKTLVNKTELKADHVHEFEVDASAAANVVTHVRLNIYPDGGVSRLRVFGTPKLE